MGVKIDRMDKESLDILNSIESAEDPRHALAALKSRISYFEQLGRDVPQALRTAEQQLKVELRAQSQGR